MHIEGLQKCAAIAMCPRRGLRCLSAEVPYPNPTACLLKVKKEKIFSALTRLTRIAMPANPVFAPLWLEKRRGRPVCAATPAYSEMILNLKAGRDMYNIC